MSLARPLNAAELTGRAESHLVSLADGQRLQAEVATAFKALQCDARKAGFELAVASCYRSYARQCAIFNGKASGERNTYADDGSPVDLTSLPADQALAALLRFSAIPGTSRHHWGTDLDVYDAAAVPAGYQVQLSPAEVRPEGVFGALHQWLDQRMVAGESHGFYRPYQTDRGGLAVERWHLSYAPLASAYPQLITPTLLVRCWDQMGGLLLRDEIERNLPELLARYVDVAPDWCPAPAGAVEGTKDGAG